MANENTDRLAADVYRQLFEYAADPIFILDTEGNFIEVNRAACDHVGYSRNELLRMRPEHIDDDASRARIPERMAQLKRERQATFEAVHVHRNGTHIPVEMHIRWIECGGKTLSLNICRNIAERKQREIEYRTIVETATDGFWVVRASDARILEVNEAYCRMFGYTRDELLSMHVSDLEAVESPEEVEAHIRKVMETGHDFFETAHRHKDGHLVEIETSVSYSSLRGGIFFSFMRDISARKRWIAEIVRSRNEIESLYNNAPCGYHSLDWQGRIIRVNQTEADWLGYQRDEMIGRKITEFQTPPSAGQFARDFPRFKCEGHVKNIEVDMVRKDGSILTALLSSAAVYDARGNYVMNRTTMLDITERKLAEIKLCDSEERFRALFEKSPIGIGISAEDKKIELANPALCRLFGYTPEELRHLTVIELTHPDYLHETRQNVDALFGGLMPSYSVEKKYLRKGGEPFWGRAIATEIMSSIPGKRYAMALVEDITVRVEQEERRLAEIQEQKNVLVREVHHRIKNNLQGVVGLLRQYAASHPELAGAIDAAAGKIYSIAAIHGLQARVLSEEVNLALLVEQIIGALECPIELSDDLLCPAVLNKDEAVPIALILNELVTNACKHSATRECSAACRPITVRLSGDGTGVAVAIANSFDGSGGENAHRGSGLNLVNSLLPKESAHLEIKRCDGIFLVELELFPPIVASKK
ncbi:MAG: PAS domain S-box protein [Nitrosomonadales bacterium]|nr:PAS domain S-box protein [Nitrosomonadales bacterium]